MADHDVALKRSGEVSAPRRYRCFGQTRSRVESTVKPGLANEAPGRLGRPRQASSLVLTSLGLGC